MPQKQKTSKHVTLLGIIAWLTGIIVSLAVGFGMIGQTLTVPFIPVVITVVAGWIVVIGAVLSVIIAIIGK
jgi:purine-cytosine permease-like protein